MNALFSPLKKQLSQGKLQSSREKTLGSRRALALPAQLLISTALIFTVSGCALFSSGVASTGEGEASGANALVNRGAPSAPTQNEDTGGSNIFARFGAYVVDLFSVRPPTTKFSQDEALVHATETFSREEEYYFGRAVAARIIARFQLVDTPEIRRYLNRLGRALASYSNQPETFGGYHFAVIDTDAFNAVAAPGGFVFVSRGLLQRMDDEEELAAILAHEIAHVTGQHGMRSLSRESLSGALQAAGLLVGSLNCDLVLQQAGLVFAAVVDELVDTLLEKGYSRELEFEADREAVVLLARAGLSPEGLGRVLHELNSMENNAGESGAGVVGVGGGWFSTHPSAGERLEKFDVNFARSAVSGRGSESTQMFAAARLARFKAAVSSLPPGKS
jgi:predicted Zn-dependent protease